MNMGNAAYRDGVMNSTALCIFGLKSIQIFKYRRRND